IASLADAKGEQAEVARTIGIPLAEAILSDWRGEGVGDDCDALLKNLPRLGGSYAQRDVFVRTLALASARAGHLTSASKVLAERGQLHRPDRFAKTLKADLL